MNEITVNLTETTEAFPNPLKGFRPTRFFGDSIFKYHEYATVYKQYIKYTDLEQSESDTAQKIKDWSNKEWAGIEEKNIKVIPRVLIAYPQVGEYWADGIPHGDPVEQWVSDELKSRLQAFIAKLGEAWDNDPRVAYIEAGLWGNWGEHHIHPYQIPGGNDRIPLDFQQAIGDAYTNAFKNKKVLIRYPKEFLDYDFGMYWDSFAHMDELVSGQIWVDRDAWRTQIVSGEPAYDYGRHRIQPGDNPNDSLSDPVHLDFINGWIRKTHASSLGWIDIYNPMEPNVPVGAEKMQKELGYRFVIKKVAYSGRVEAGGKLNVTFDVINQGSAPFYYDWPVQVSLLNSDKSVAWKGTFDTDIRTWLPGDKWNDSTKVYEVAPVEYHVSGEFELPQDLNNGTYTLAFSILDPAGNAPSLKFANTNYYNGGRTPIGKLGIGEDPTDQDLGPFDSLKLDYTLSYSLK